MNIIYYRRVIFTFKLNNININKIKNSIKIISDINKFIIYSKNINNKNVLSKKIIFNIKKKYLIINFSHLFYDAYSIFYILNKVDLIYKNEINDIKEIKF
jgi:hypothetical protein